MFSDIRHLYADLLCQPKLGKDYCVVFVYNSKKHIRDKIHATECIDPEECNMITESFRKSTEYVYAIEGEIAFQKRISDLKKKHHHILVYSMAQNLNGVGRRSLIPLLCDYYNLINLNAQFLPSTLGGSKILMHTLIETTESISFPTTVHINNQEDIEYFIRNNNSKVYLLKPNDESASIGVKLVDFSIHTDKELEDILYSFHKQYPVFSIQQFIQGEEVEVSLFHFQEKYYCPGVCQIVFNGSSDYLDYDTVALTNYGFKEYLHEARYKLIDISRQIAQKLGFGAICRIDFRVQNNIGYVIDIGPNPTISEYSSTNYIFRKHLYNDKSSVYRLLLYKSLIENHLFKPSFN